MVCGHAGKTGGGFNTKVWFQDINKAHAELEPSSETSASIQDYVSSIGYTNCVSCMQDASDVTDFRISQWLTVYINSVFCWLYCVDVSNTKEVLQVHAASSFIYAFLLLCSIQ
jgi:hypothetical protein